MLDEENGRVYFKGSLAQTTRGNVTSGQGLAYADTRPDVFPRGYSGDRLTTNIGPMANGTAQYTATLASASLPIRKYKVSVAYEVGGTNYVMGDYNGDGNLYGVGGDWGTVNYTNGAVEINLDGNTPGAGDVGNAITVTWSTNFEAQTEINDTLSLPYL